MKIIGDLSLKAAVLLAGLFFLLPGTSSAQEIEFASSPNPVGSGARALGMGGAFIAVADDATAASWNPGGLIQLELPEVSIVGAWFHRSEDNTFPLQPEGNGTQSISEGNLNYLSAAYPFVLLNRNMIVALTYQHLYDFNRSWQLELNYRDDDLFLNRMVDYNQDGGLTAFGISYAVQITPAVSAGMTLNIWDDDLGYNHWTQNTFYTAQGNLFGTYSINDTYRNIDTYSFEGYNFNIGFLWRITESLTLGGVFKSPFTADVRHEATLSEKIILVDDPAYPPLWELEEQGVFDEELDMPASYGLGIAYRFSDALTASFDLYRTEWGDMLYTDNEGVKTSAISGVEESKSDIDATMQMRAGMEYLIIKPKFIVPLRAGLFYDPAPSEGSSDDFYGFTVGTGFGWKRYIFDVGYQFRYGSDVGSAIYKSGELAQDVSEHTFYASLIVHF